jgi:hypothetical protein
VDALRRALMSYSAIPAALDMEEEPGRRPDLLTAKSLTKVSETELAWMAAERALAAAERAEEPLLVGASAYHIVMPSFVPAATARRPL